MPAGRAPGAFARSTRRGSAGQGRAAARRSPSGPALRSGSPSRPPGRRDGRSSAGRRRPCRPCAARTARRGGRPRRHAPWGGARRSGRSAATTSVSPTARRRARRGAAAHRGCRHAPRARPARPRPSSWDRDHFGSIGAVSSIRSPGAPGRCTSMVAGIDELLDLQVLERRSRWRVPSTFSLS